ncbi:hypothetical protein [Salidesulfovibrio onnuriiensis]|uniref:hypothetical protein n=1 Tax=Salidesulfovibrio onnuriiensis TaxID=2583823 RepID=UPI0011C7A309|nr:hypothetical protein [Salidesulfovibrio onnuriiensis]
MPGFRRSLVVLAAILVVDILFYGLFIKPDMMRWGATPEEAAASLPGDDIAPLVSSTRAIGIAAPRAAVWPWLVQLGADRGGFYSYTFLEKLIGYENDNAVNIVPEHQAMPVGRIVPSSPFGTQKARELSWRVLSVEPGVSFVLEGWGPFVIRDAPGGNSRLLVRTHGWDTPTWVDRAGYEIMMPLHYIMERRMLLGIKARVEAGPGVRLSPLPDYLWFGGIFLSGLGVLLLVFMGRGVAGYLIPTVLSLAWLWTLLVLAPTPLPALGLAAFVIAAFAATFFRKSKRA